MERWRREAPPSLSPALQRLPCGVTETGGLKRISSPYQAPTCFPQRCSLSLLQLHAHDSVQTWTVWFHFYALPSYFLLVLKVLKKQDRPIKFSYLGLG